MFLNTKKIFFLHFLVMLIFLYLTDKANAQWIKVDDGPAWCFADDGTYIYAGLYGGLYIPGDTIPPRNIIRSSDNGISWENISNGLTSKSVYSLKVFSLAVKGNKIFAGTDNGIFVSSNQGENWSQLDFYPSPSIGSVYCLMVNDSAIFAGVDGGGTINDNGCNYGGIFRSTDDGNTWVYASTGLKDNCEDKRIHTFTKIGTTLFAGSDLGGVFSSTNNGESWVHSYESYNWQVGSFAVIDSTLFGGMWSGSVFRSTDMGLTWTRCDSGLTDSVTNYDLIILSLGVSGKNLFAGTFLHGVYLSTNMGNSWLSINDNQGIGYGSDINSLVVIDNNIFAGASGIWRRPLREVTSLGESSYLQPDRFNVAQNYPNPFNPATTINYSIPSRSFVTITVYDVLGRKVATLANYEQEAGTHQIKFDGSSFPSGIYFYRLTAGKNIAVKKMVLVR
jgi:Secretion system C-terminal sorting domain